MHRIFLAASALACVCSPAMAGAGPVEGMPATGGFAHGLAFGLLLLGAMALAVVVSLARRAMLPVLGVFVLIVTILTCAAVPAFASPIPPSSFCLQDALHSFCATAQGGAISLTPYVQAAAEVAIAGDTALPLPWGRWLSDLAQVSFDVFLLLLPPLAAWAAQAIRKRNMWAGLVLTQTRLEQLATALAEHGLSAVKGAVKGKQLSVELGSRVIAAGLGRGAEAVPRIVWEQAGGAEGVAKLILRKLDLDEEADEHAVLGPALASFRASAAAR